MKRHVLLIADYDINKVKRILKDRKIPFHHAGYPNGEVEVTERYPSKINVHEELTKFAKFKGYKSLSDAVRKVGGRQLKKQYENAIIK